MEIMIEESVMMEIVVNIAEVVKVAAVVVS